ncbi:hypothetical protein PSEUDO9AZ_10722 [Pseudomonas sp. 9AZ]|uniref:hypothetical protein n=1 Tax=Pseudomonas sp. 9AZ TaxID=2653168 RepID=UPI0012F299B4|nr:hypothetical protein [Pseudomonas sp. 9AZ]VXC39853.1 hypothetical protein PSEUDO9AZ_10722 [Pseudomonas sp. 9AZ]
MATENTQKLNVEKIAELRKQIEAQLKSSIAEDGTVDLLKLRENNKPLAEVFDIITLSKTWRDDPKQFAKDVARMVSAREQDSDLSSALKKLETRLAPKKTKNQKTSK